jgi:DNA-binding MarR family transcriptional regulator
LLVVESLGGGRVVLERRRRVVSRLVAVVEEGRGERKDGGGLPSLIGEGVVGGILSVLHARFSDGEGSFIDLMGPLVGMIVLPYLGLAAARRESARPVASASLGVRAGRSDLLQDLGMRLTYRTVRVLLAVAATPGGSNRQIADGSGISDQGQISKLLARLQGLGIVENGAGRRARGVPNAWALTAKGREIENALAAKREQS